MKHRRNAIAVKSKLAELCEVIDKCCSEDETDAEAERVEPRKKVYNVKKFPWRHTRLEALVLRLEAHDDKKRKDSPKGTKGAKPRDRVRNSTLISQSKTPPGLPFDCYDPEWLEELQNNNPDQYEALQVDPTPILDNLERKADRFLKV